MADKRSRSSTPTHSSIWWIVRLCGPSSSTWAPVGAMNRPSDVPPETTDADILREARSGNKILAVKWYRSLYGVGLKEAKDAVEKMMDEDQGGKNS